MSRPVGWSFLSWFAATFVLLYVGYALVPEPLLRDQIYFHGITEPSQHLLKWVLPDMPVSALGNHLQSAQVDLSIVRGCDGAGIVLLLVAAIVAQRSGWRRSLIGILGAIALVYLLNEVRISALFLVAAFHPAKFGPIHVYWVPTLMVVISALYFAVWNARCPPHARLTAET